MHPFLFSAYYIPINLSSDNDLGGSSILEIISLKHHQQSDFFESQGISQAAKSKHPGLVCSLFFTTVRVCRLEPAAVIAAPMNSIPGLNMGIASQYNIINELICMSNTSYAQQYFFPCLLEETTCFTCQEGAGLSWGSSPQQPGGEDQPQQGQAQVNETSYLLLASVPNLP